jgi:hypothetical protein
MSFHSWLQNLQSPLAPGWGTRKSRRRGSLSRRRGGSPRAARHRLHLEVLEDRRLLAFLGPASYGVGNGPSGIVAADLNGDTFIDLATANRYHVVSVLLSDGAGGFGPARTVKTWSNPHSLATGDFDGDGDLDLVTAATWDLAVQENNGDGTFATAQRLSFSGGTNLKSVAVGDFNADGKMDLGVASNRWDGYCYYGYCYGYYRGFAHVLLGDGGGGFNETASVLLNSSQPTSVALGDVNNDGQLDLVAGDDSGGGVDVLLGNRDGTLQSPSSYGTGGGSDYSVAIGDLNADGNLDLATVHRYGNNAAVLLGDGSGAFPTYNHYATGDYPLSVALEDFDQDGRLDLVTANPDSDDIAVLRGNGDGTFQAALAAPGDAPNRVAVADFNGDGSPDVAVTNHALDMVSVLLNDGDWPAPGVPTVSVGDASVIEGHTGTANASFTVTLSSDPIDTVTIDYATGNGSAATGDGDYQSVAGTLAFNPGDPLTQTVLVPVNGDRRGEADETFVVNLTSATGAVIIDSQGLGTIRDDEPRVSIDDDAVAEGHSGTSALSFLVTLSNVYDVDVTVSFVTQDGLATTADDDYQAAAGDVVIPAGQTTAPIDVPVNGDTKPEDDEYLLVNLSSVTAVVVDGQGDGVIQNDDEAPTKFYVVDSSADRTYEYQADGHAVEDYRLRSDNNDPRGAASDASGEHVWVIDNDDYVYVYDAAGNSRGAWKAKGLSTPEGIASDGTDLWIVDRGKDRVYRFVGGANRTSGSASATSSFALNSGNRDAKGLETDGTHLWVVNDASTNKVFKYTLSGALVGSWTISGSNTTPTGITLDPSNPSDIWIVDSGRDQVFQYSAAASRTSGSQSPSAVFNLAAGNSNPQGIADPRPAVSQASNPTLSTGNAVVHSASARFAFSGHLPAPSTASRPSKETPRVDRGRKPKEHDVQHGRDLFNDFDAVFGEPEYQGGITDDFHR